MSGREWVRSYWDAAGAGNRLATWSAPSSNFASALTAPMVKDRARDAYRNNPWARRAVDLLSTDAIGVGIKPQLRTDDIGRKRAFERAWNEWVEVADFSGRFDLYGFQKNAFRAVVVDGECIVRMVPSPGQRVPLQLQLLGSEFMDDSRVNLSATGPASLNGIKYDESGRRVAFHLFRKHPALAPTIVSVEVSGRSGGAPVLARATGRGARRVTPCACPGSLARTARVHRSAVGPLQGRGAVLRVHQDERRQHAT